jgi:hypothetical protein
MKMDTNHHILNAASNLLGISLLIIAGLHIGSAAAKTFADEIAWVAAICFSAASVLSYFSIRSSHGERLEKLADKVFISGLLSLMTSVAVIGFSNFN